MYQLYVPVIVNGTEDVSRETIYTVNDFPFSDFQTLRECRKRGRKKNPIVYYDVEMAFDIETTTLEKVTSFFGTIATTIKTAFFKVVKLVKTSLNINQEDE